MRWANAGGLVLAGISGGCLSIHSHYALLDAEGPTRLADRVGQGLSAGVYSAMILTAMAAGASLFWAGRRWRSRRAQGQGSLSKECPAGVSTEPGIAANAEQASAADRPRDTRFSATVR